MLARRRQDGPGSKDEEFYGREVSSRGPSRDDYEDQEGGEPHYDSDDDWDKKVLAARNIGGGRRK